MFILMGLLINVYVCMLNQVFSERNLSLSLGDSRSVSLSLSLGDSRSTSEKGLHVFDSLISFMFCLIHGLLLSVFLLDVKLDII